MNNVIGLSRQWLSRNMLTWQRLLLIGGVLALSVIVPQRASGNQMQLLIALLPGIGAILLFLRWPPLGLLLLIVNGLLLPSPDLPGGLNLAVLHLGLLIGLWLLEMIVGRGEIRLVLSRAIWPLLAFVGVAILAFGVGNLPWFPATQPAPLDAQLGGLAIFVLSAGAFLLVAHQVQDIRWLQGMTWLYLALGALFIAGWIVPQIGRFTGRFFQGRATSNSMFWTWLVTLAFSQAFYNRRLHLGWRAALGGLVLATLYVAYVRNSSWKSGYLPPMVSIAVIVGLRYPRAGLFLALAGIIPAQYLATEAVATDQYSVGTRLDAWLLVLDMVKINPILGFGPANYYWYTPLFPIRGYYLSFNSHSQYVDIIAQTGLLGLFTFLWFAWAVGWLGLRLRTKVPEGFAQAYVYGALGGLVGTLASGVLVDWFLPFVYNIGLKGFRTGMLPWLFLGGLVSLEQMMRRTDDSPET